MNYPDLKIHPLCAKLRGHTPQEAKALKDQFDAKGEFDPAFPIILFEHKGEEKILAGRHRYKEAKKRDWDVNIKRFKGTDEEAAAFVFREQLGRRNLNASERAATMALYMDELGIDSIEEAATKADVSYSQMSKARSVHKRDPKFTEKAIRNELSIDAAVKKLAKTRPEKFDANAVPWEETAKAFDAAAIKLRDWAVSELEVLFGRPGGEHLTTSLHYRRLSTNGESKRTGIDLVDGLLETLRACKPRVCPDCDGAGCQTCKRLGHVSASENAGRKARKK